MVRIPAVVAATFALVVVPLSAAAQFTAAVVPPNAMLVDSAPSASIPREANGRTAIEMRDGPLHIDSSLGTIASAIGGTVSESVRPTEETAARASLTPSTARSPDSDPDGDTIFRDGASAPETDSPLPVLALVGAGTLLIGVALLRR